MDVQIRVTCCFCGELITPTGYDPCSLVLSTQWARPTQTVHAEQLFCHAECLQAAVHPDQRPILTDPQAFELQTDNAGVLHPVPAPPEHGSRYPCSFCGKTQFEVQRLIPASGGVAICNECIDLCNDILDSEGIPPV